MSGLLPTLSPLMADYLKLFHDKRLTVSEPYHLEYIKGRLANLKIDDPKMYQEYSEFYGVEVEAQVTKLPKVTDTASTTIKKKAKKTSTPA